MDKYSSLGIRSASRVLNPVEIKKALNVSDVVIEKVSITETAKVQEADSAISSPEPLLDAEQGQVSSKATQEPPAAEPPAAEPPVGDKRVTDEPPVVKPASAPNPVEKPVEKTEPKSDKNKPRTNFR